MTPSEFISLASLLLTFAIGYVTLRNSRTLLALSIAKKDKVVATAPIKAEERADDLLKQVVSGWDKAIDKFERLIAEMHDKNDLERTRQEQLDKDDKTTSAALTTLRKEMPGAVRVEMKQDFDAVQRLVDEFRKEMEDKFDQVSSAIKSLADRAPQVPPAPPAPLHIEVNNTSASPAAVPAAKPPTLPEQAGQTQKLGDTLPSADPDPTQQGVKSPFYNGQPSAPPSTPEKAL